jgi:hypothetical protein
MIKKIMRNKYLKLLRKNTKQKKEIKELKRIIEVKNKQIIELQNVNYEISCNNLYITEQNKKYKKKNRQIRQELIEERYKNENK